VTPPYQVFGALAPEEYNALKADIAEHGVQVPVVVDEDGNVLDGHNRVRTCNELGITDYPRIVRSGLSEQEKRDLARSLNLQRRHLSGEQKRQVVADQLRETPARSDRAIGRLLGVDHVTVATVRRQLQLSGELHQIGARQVERGGTTYLQTAAPRPDRAADPGDQADPDRIALAHDLLADPAIADALLEDATGRDRLYDAIGRRGRRVAAQERAVQQQILASGSAEWYTPAPYIAAVRELLDGIDLDPASCAQANETVQARHYYTEADDGLSQPWAGKVFLNPPYGHHLGQSNAARWSRRLLEAYRNGEISEAVLLINAVPAEHWFRPLWDFPICFTDHRIRFVSPDGTSTSPTHSNAFVYLGPQRNRFRGRFARFGPVVTRMRLECEDCYTVREAELEREALAILAEEQQP
jgi:ParB-like chromosome segregation protein Spo0J